MRGVFVLCLALGAAHAEDRAGARAATEGERLYDVGEYQSALDAFKRAYVASEDAKLLFRIGECQQQLGNKAEALRAYRNYLRKLPDASNRDEVEARITGLEGAESAAPKPAPKPPAAVPATPPAPAVPPPLQATTSKQGSVYDPWGGGTRGGAAPSPPVVAPPVVAAPVAAPPVPAPPVVVAPPVAAPAPVVVANEGPPRKSRAWIAGVVVGAAVVLGIVVGVSVAYSIPNNAQSSLPTTDVSF